MDGKRWYVWALVPLLALALLCGRLCSTRAEEDKPSDEGKVEDFKGKTFDLKEKGKAAIILAFPAGKEVTLTVRCDKKPDVNLFVHDSAGKEVAKDDSKGPDCDIKYTSKDGGKYTIEVVNLGPGETKATLKATVK
jgi:hypothetical protein